MRRSYPPISFLSLSPLGPWEQRLGPPVESLESVVYLGRKTLPTKTFGFKRAPIAGPRRPQVPSMGFTLPASRPRLRAQRSRVESSPAPFGSAAAPLAPWRSPPPRLRYIYIYIIYAYIQLQTRQTMKTHSVVLLASWMCMYFGWR